ncbi:expressed unknown protein [Seminavis robusta]|uniref:Uncharacterized protein n=1 Tax=Seminavis robusta TaxID=568900 RepID=A0A9N8HS86_9STRA|nr:expressed unknown protein [Seminavis robusta]|eukprot:Sro1683_g290950.1 n/a (324) ;mRNA; f:15978-16949
MARLLKKLRAKRKLAALQEAEAAAAAEAAEKQAQCRRNARWSLVLVGIILAGTLAFTKEGITLLVENVQTIVAKSNSTTASQTNPKPINISALPLPSLEPFDMKKYDTIHFWHLRKAGGTSLRIYVEAIAKYHNLTFNVDEGMCYKGPHSDQKTLLVTMIKDPVARIVSEYWGEGNVNLTNPRSFMDFIDDRNTTQPKRISDDHWFIWGCSHNCLTRIFGNGRPSNVPADLSKAKQALEHDFDLVIQSNRMGDPRYQQWLSQILGAPSIKLPHRNHADRKQFAENKIAAPKEHELELLRRTNQLDYDLLEYIIPRRKDLVGVV